MYPSVAADFCGVWRLSFESVGFESYTQKLPHGCYFFRSNFAGNVVTVWKALEIFKNRRSRFFVCLLIPYLNCFDID